jgi:hypothetical protein
MPLFGSAAVSAASLAVQVCRGLFRPPCLLKTPISPGLQFQLCQTKPTYLFKPINQINSIQFSQLNEFNLI